METKKKEKGTRSHIDRLDTHHRRATPSARAIIPPSRLPPTHLAPTYLQVVVATEYNATAEQPHGHDHRSIDTITICMCGWKLVCLFCFFFFLSREYEKRSVIKVDLPIELPVDA